MQDMTKATNFSVFPTFFIILSCNKEKVREIEKFFFYEEYSMTVKNAAGDDEEGERWWMRWSFPCDDVDEKNYSEKFNENFDRFNYFVNMRFVYVCGSEATSWTTRDGRLKFSPFKQEF